MHRVTLFVDGSNLAGTLRQMNLRVESYEAFYRFIFDETVRAWKACLSGPEPTVMMTRVLWYVLGSLDDWDLDEPRVESTLRDAFDRDQRVRRTYMALAAQKLGEEAGETLPREAWKLCFAEIKEWYARRRDLVAGFCRFYSKIRHTTDFVEIVECGHWRADMLARTVSEKGLDTRLAVDMVALADSYDRAVLVSGDADSIPSLEYARRRGKHVAVVEILRGTPETKGTTTSSRLRDVADLVVQVYEGELVLRGIAWRNAGAPPAGESAV
jgi:uncharacterized LabA/DUF88 family protein